MLEIPLEAISSDDDQKPATKKLRVTQFEFPPTEFQYRNWKSLEEVITYFEKNRVEEWKYTQRMYTARSYVNQKKDCRKVTLECRVCHIKVLVRVFEETKKIQFDKFENMHKHVVNHRTKILQEEMICQYLASLPPSEKYHEYYKVLMDKFSINASRVRYVMNKFTGKSTESIQEIMERVKAQIGAQFRIWRDPLKDNRETMILMVSDAMVQNYKKYGDCLCFDFTYRLVRKERYFNEFNEMVEEEWGTGFFMGQDSNLRMTLFGVCLVKQETSENIREIFAAFFGIMNNRQPQTIITDDQGALGKALKDLRKQNGYKWDHLLDQFHKLQALKRLMVKQHIHRQERSQLLRCFSTLMKEPNAVIFRHQVQEMMEYVEERQIVQNFLKEQHLYCTSQIGKNFFGFSVASVRVEGFNNVIKNYIPFSTHIAKFFTQMIRVERHLNNRTATVIRSKENAVHPSLYEPLGNLRMQLEERVFDNLLSNVSRLRYLQLEDPINTDEKKKRSIFVIQRGFKHQVTYHERLDFWICNCNYIFHTGIPCVHLLMVLSRFKVPVHHYVKPRWFRYETNQQIEKNKSHLIFSARFPNRNQRTKNDMQPNGYLFVQGNTFIKKVDALKKKRLLQEFKQDRVDKYVRYCGKSFQAQRIRLGVYS